MEMAYTEEESRLIVAAIRSLKSWPPEVSYAKLRHKGKFDTFTETDKAWKQLREKIEATNYQADSQKTSNLNTSLDPDDTAQQNQYQLSIKEDLDETPSIDNVSFTTAWESFPTAYVEPAVHNKQEEDYHDENENLVPTKQLDEIPDDEGVGYDVVAVDVAAGAEREIFKIVKSHAMSVSRYFCLVLSSSEGALDQSVHLPEENAQIFEYFHDFLRLGMVINRSMPGDLCSTGLYGQYILRSHTTDAPLLITSADHQRDKEWERLAHAWHLGERLDAIPFRDVVVDAIIRKLCQGDHTPVALYKTLHRSDSQRTACIKRLMIDVALWTWGDELFETDSMREGLRENTEFLLDLMAVLAKVRINGIPGVPFFERNTCFYHEHREHNKPCYRDGSHASVDARARQEEALHGAQPSLDLSPQPSPQPPSPPPSTLEVNSEPPPPSPSPSPSPPSSIALGLRKQPFRLPRFPDAYYARATAGWGVMPEREKHRFAHVSRMEETDLGQACSSACNRCMENGWRCMRYSAQGEKWYGYLMEYSACARCYFNDCGRGKCATAALPFAH